MSLNVFTRRNSHRNTDLVLDITMKFIYIYIYQIKILLSARLKKHIGLMDNVSYRPELSWKYQIGLLNNPVWQYKIKIIGICFSNVKIRSNKCLDNISKFSTGICNKKNFTYKKHSWWSQIMDSNWDFVY